MAKRKSKDTRTDILDWWQAVIDETKDFVDDGIDRLRDRGSGDELADDIEELKQAVAELNTKLERIASRK
jgi:cell shape-determining protein MreC